MLEDVLPGNLRRAAAVLGPIPGLRYAASIEDAVRDADLAIDTVPDELESKLEILSLLDRMAPPHTLFATPTEVLSIADLASCTYRPGQCFGLRFRSMEPLRLELHHPSSVGPEVLAKATSFLFALAAELEVHVDARALP